MFESEEAAKSRLQFISQLAGSTAGLSMLAACGGGSGLVDSRGNPSAPSAGIAPGSPLLAGQPTAIITLPPLRDTAELQKSMFEADCRAVTRNGLAVIRDDLKSNTNFVNKINSRLALDRISHHEHGKLSPQVLGDDGDDGGDGDWGDGVYYPPPGPHDGPQVRGGLPKVYSFGPIDCMPPYNRAGYNDVYGEVNKYGFTVFVGIWYPWSAGPIYYTSPDTRPNCTSLEQPLINLANAIVAWCNNHSSVCVAGNVITWFIKNYLAKRGITAYELVMLALAFLSEAELLPLVGAVGGAIFLWWLVGCPSLIEYGL